MLTSTRKIVVAALAVTSLTAIRPAAADDRARQFAGSFLQALADGLNNGGGQPNPGGGGFVPPVTPAVNPWVGPAVNPNPVVFNGGVNVTGVGTDAFGRPVVQTNQTVATASAFDPNRNVVDPGSMQTSSSIVTDSFGNSYQETTTSWTSFGVPHSDTNRQLVTQSASGVSIDQQQVVKSGRARRNTTTTPLRGQVRHNSRPRGHR